MFVEIVNKIHARDPQQFFWNALYFYCGIVVSDEER